MPMHLGAFSVSLVVKDLTVSKTFYEALGFTPFGGDADQGWLILKNGETILGLFQGMFEKNMLTFNPGWNQNAEPLDSYTDIRALQAALKDRGLTFETETDPDGTGPAHITLTDPDGNPILIDQHR
jgi:lactoylglutathione lyase